MSRETEFLVERERVWRARLRGVSLACELDIPEAEARSILKNLGRPYFELGDRERRRLIVDHYPACVVVGLAGVGTTEYDQGRFWPLAVVSVSRPGRSGRSRAEREQAQAARMSCPYLDEGYAHAEPLQVLRCSVERHERERE